MIRFRKRRQDWTAADIAALRRAGLFDADFYQARRGVQTANPIEDYLRHGEALGIPPSLSFDPVFYRLTNPDVVDAGLSPLIHYIRYGRKEGRPPTAFTALRENKGQVQIDSGVERTFFERLYRRFFGDVDDEDFDEAFYSQAYPDVRPYGKPAIIHYIEVGQKQQRPINRRQLVKAVAEIRPFFDASYYRDRARISGGRTDPIEHYLTIGRFLEFDPSPEFSVSYYLRAYPDIAQAGIEPFTHYIRHGKRERRVGRPDFMKGRVQGEQTYDFARGTVVLVNHDASRTGAPMVGVELARHFGEYFNVVVCTLREGELVEQFAKNAFQVMVGPVGPADSEFLLEHLKKSFPIEAVVLNSVETASFAPGALYAGVPSVALIHEFAEYTMPPGKTSKVAAAVDRAIVPAKLVLASLQHEMEFQFGAPTSNAVIRPQGIMAARPGRAAHDAEEDLSEADILARLGHPKTKPPIVLCAGFVHMRKGVELFVQTAQEVRREIPDVRFVWAGAGYTPQKDVHYSVWLQETIRRLGLEKTVVFLPPQISMDHLYSLCDVFFLSSRMDPFPSVVLEAMQFGKQVVCFDQATGSAELFENGLARGAAVEYANVSQAARAIVDILRSDPVEAAEINRAVIAEKFRFDDYVAFIKGQIDAAKEHRARIDEATSLIVERKAFDADFHEGRHVLNADQMRACQDYVARHAKGLSKFSPRPGFSDNVYRSQTNLASGKIPLEEALKAQTGGALPVTHRCVRLEDTRTGLRSRAALHIHFHYPELAYEFIERLNAAALPIDLFLTTTARRNLTELQSKFADYKFGKVEYVAVPNRGRDIGPFLTTIRSQMSKGNYDVVGHLHAKRSLAVDKAMGDRWRKYLLDTLLGTGLRHLLGLFDEDEKLGLVFAEDRHVNGWGKNLPFAQDLARRAKPQLTLPAHPYFPLGTMFWARPAALEPLWNINFKVEDFPPEPVPYDGSVLHALERVLPSCAEAAGYKWCTVYDPRNSW